MFFLGGGVHGGIIFFLGCMVCLGKGIRRVNFRSFLKRLGWAGQHEDEEREDLKVNLEEQSVKRF